MVQGLAKELKLKSSTPKITIETIYFGGGTPSILTEKALNFLMETIKTYYNVSTSAEITLEANPDDIDVEKAISWKRSGINRLSIGIQTFNDKILNILNRSHTANQALKSIERVRKAGFDNISADLMFALPDSNDAELKADLKILKNLDLPHLSIYGLTIEEKTVFGRWKNQNKRVFPSDIDYERNYRMVHEVLTQHHYEHYEVSSFAKKKKFSRHNTSYWLQKSYLGIGPGAHSFDGEYRSQNIGNNQLYLKNLDFGHIHQTSEALSLTEKMNEYIMLRLRTCFGLDFVLFKKEFHRDIKSENLKLIDQICLEGLGFLEKNKLKLTFDGFLNSDEICTQLFYPMP
tara:strand:- start:82 stop:1119 length:1038 start_codon:yes stop_codon:yes gene_type:complete